MLPYFEHITISIGPITIFVWGLFVACGIGAALLLARREARRAQIEYTHIVDLTLWIVVAAFIGARLAHIFFYEPAFFIAHPSEIIMVWHGGLSSVGGICAGILGACAYVWRHKLHIATYGDVVARSIPLAWIISRMGCYVTHMHPGIHSTLPFAVNYPDGPRLDIGLLESVAWMLIGAVLWIMPQPQRKGVYLALVPLLYAPVRFGLDFLRATDTEMPDMRYGGLTPAQYGMIILFCVGIYTVYRFKLLKKYDA